MGTSLPTVRRPNTSRKIVVVWHRSSFSNSAGTPSSPAAWPAGRARRGSPFRHRRGRAQRRWLAGVWPHSSRRAAAPADAHCALSVSRTRTPPWMPAKCCAQKSATSSAGWRGCLRPGATWRPAALGGHNTGEWRGEPPPGRCRRPRAPHPVRFSRRTRLCRGSINVFGRFCLTESSLTAILSRPTLARTSSEPPIARLLQSRAAPHRSARVRKDRDLPRPE